MKLFIAGLPNDFDNTDLKEMFELYGEVVSAKLIMDKVTGKSKGFGFVEMPDKLEAQQTIESLDGVGFKGGKKLSVKEAEEQPVNKGYGRNTNTRFNNRY
jgi:RNA recognition motif-containing protein